MMNQSSTLRRGTLEYRPAIDGLRALAVLSVFIFHLNRNWLPGGFVGVDVFFVISGYLITSIIFKECQNGSFSLKKFYQRRIARIFPAFFIVALVTLAAANFIYSPQDLASAGANLTAAVLSVANMKFMLQGNYFQISPDAQPFLHYWSLSVEEQFYIIFPLLFMLVFKYARKHLVLMLGSLCVLSLVTCVVLTSLKPVWAFYLLPTRGWELLVGGLLAVLASGVTTEPGTRWPRLLSASSLGLIALSFLLIHEGNHFPSYWALLPVMGTVGVLMPAFGSGGISERLLAATPLVLVGRISYSLYLWHWPVFSLVDYKMYLASEPARFALKISMSFLAAVLSFCFIENPARLSLNSRRHMPLAFASLVCALAICVPLGIAVRKANYISAEPSDVSRGGLVFNSKSKANSVILMGDSNGSMYGKVMKEICHDLGWNLVVICVAAGDPLPSSNITSGRLWLDSFAVVQRETPDCLVLACSWDSKLQDDKERLALAVKALKPFVGHLVILNQPPILPENANRASIREGARPPFYEDAGIRRRRMESNDYLKSFNSKNCSVVDIASHFQTTNGEVLFQDSLGRQLYHDRGHLSGFGADLIRSDLTEAVSRSARSKFE
jgi:peptidoglycan/LPS O-acetylase OafA/YrhL